LEERGCCVGAKVEGGAAGEGWDAARAGMQGKMGACGRLVNLGKEPAVRVSPAEKEPEL